MSDETQETGATAKIVVATATALAALMAGQPVFEAMQGRHEDAEHVEATTERSDTTLEASNLFEAVAVSDDLSVPLTG